MNELVRLSTNDVNNASPVCSSRDIAVSFKKRHSDVIRAIENIISTNVEVRSLKWFVLSKYKDKKGESRKEYLMNRDGFSLLAMGFNNKTALEWKLKYIKAFNFMEQELKARLETRYIGKSVRKELTDTIKDKVKEEGNFKRFAYSNYSKLVYKKVLGMTVKKAKEQRGLKEKDNIRNFLTIDELKQVQELESKIAYYIEMRTDLTDDDKEVYAEVKKYIEQERED